MNKLLGLGRYEQTVRKSRFVGVCGPIDRSEDAADFIQQHGAKDCKHVCWAFRAGDHHRFDDAGEPSGTAGRPILAAIDQFELDFAVVVVNRYFGGVKLGTGGLARAFSSTAMRVIEQAIERHGWQPIVKTREIRCSAPFEWEAVLHRLVGAHNGRALSTDYTAMGLVLTAEMPVDEIQRFKHELIDHSRGQAEVEPDHLTQN